MTKGYVPHDFRSVGIYKKSEPNTENMGQLYPVFTWSEFLLNMFEAFVVNADYTKYEQALTKTYSPHD